MNGDVFAELVVVPDDQPGGLTRVFEVLRCVPDDGTCVEPVAGADRGVAGQVDSGTEDIAGTEDNVFIDDGIGADRAAFAQLGTGMDESSGMDHEPTEL
jgi:hypothetical protein